MNLRELDQMIEGLQTTRESMSLTVDGLTCTPLNSKQINIEIPAPDGNHISLNVPIATIGHLYSWLQGLMLEGEDVE